MRWKLWKHGMFDAWYFYHALRGSNEQRFPYKGIWGVKAPIRVSFLCGPQLGVRFSLVTI
jgi:hypothetical protein